MNKITEIKTVLFEEEDCPPQLVGLFLDYPETINAIFNHLIDNLKSTDLLTPEKQASINKQREGYLNDCCQLQTIEYDEGTYMYYIKILNVPSTWEITRSIFDE